MRCSAAAPGLLTPAPAETRTGRGDDAGDDDGARGASVAGHGAQEISPGPIGQDWCGERGGGQMTGRGHGARGQGGKGAIGQVDAEKGKRLEKHEPPVDRPVFGRSRIVASHRRVASQGYRSLSMSTRCIYRRLG